ncbi:UDP-N-acetylmuramate dehydrogenase [Biformimicrobium ophioploci]|uniref:UDP-N-acetylenolpyruvoylglucosamine reductase n=1 Tax=Biformimicrobium ophioploci TaxID=3036711 RepID=A0ABQ6M1N6_9GAMM|nr:UDP-N-acetylmuramate dehydrogenase [Microbulbifer sp. NKW57]
MNLAPLNTMAVPARARWFVRATDLESLSEALAFAHQRDLPLLVLGGGSNMLLCEDFPGLVVQVANAGVKQVRDASGWRVTASAGENWHSLVMETVEAGIGGLENLALIPGNIGAAPIQNIGAYGVELESVFSSLRAMEVRTGEMVTFSRNDCDFGYRDSVFKNAARDRYIITEVEMHLPDQWVPRLGYPALQEAVSGVAEDISPAAVAQAVIKVRQSKLPDPATLPNSGSFFKNPVVSDTKYRALKESWPDLVAYQQENGWKLAAGWLIDRAGWRGRRRDGVGVHEAQALVLVNPGHAPGAEVAALAAEVAADIDARFGVRLEPEPRFYPEQPWMK